jgi:hypothetical protein
MMTKVGPQSQSFLPLNERQNDLAIAENENEMMTLIE